VREAGVAKPTLYAHFGSKAELVAAVLAELPHGGPAAAAAAVSDAAAAARLLVDAA
jgi:AcrR family transcriptional regulator